ncbi:MAG: glycosyltransferase family 4 protein, partial [Azoarcus sp.]|nr:glycosyltransferase family 4 protein [Azoarcus sp.]
GLKICLAGPLPPPAGGMANQMRQLSECLRAEGAVVEPVQVNAPCRPAWIEHLKGIRAGWRLPPYARALWRACGRADLVHVMANSGWSWHLFAVPAIRIAALRGAPVVVHYHGGEAAAFLEKAAARVRKNLRRCAGLLLPSGFLLEVFARHGMRGRIVPNIVDPACFHPAGARGRDPQAPHIVVARNLEPIYGMDAALHAFARIAAALPRARLSIAGGGSERAALEELARHLGVAAGVRFTGRLEREQMAALYRDADLAINPSRVDNMPVSVLEALASGVPVVSTDVGGVPFVVEQGRTAMLAPPDDPGALAAAALEVLGDGELARRLREAGIAEARQYCWDAVKGKLLAAYRDAMAPEIRVAHPLC